MRLRSVLVVVSLLLVAIVLQTTLFSQTVVFIPDLVMLVVILLSLTRLRPELVLGIAFVSGLAVDRSGRPYWVYGRSCSRSWPMWPFVPKNGPTWDGSSSGCGWGCSPSEAWCCSY